MSIERTNPITGTEAQRRWLQANAATIEAAEEGASIGAQELHTSVDGAGLKRVFRCHENIGRTYHLGTVANEAAMLALDSPLTSHACLPGDTCFRSDTQQIMRCVSDYGVSVGDWEVVYSSAGSADPAGTAAAVVAVHNTATDSHTDIRTLVADRVPISTTRLGSVGNTPLTTTALSAADWAALPVGWRGIISADVALASGLPAADVYHLQKVSNRDVSGGAAYQAQGYLSPTLYVGVAATSSDLPTWSVALTSAPGTTVSNVGASLLSTATPTAQKIPRINADGSVTLIDVPSGGGGSITEVTPSWPTTTHTFASFGDTNGLISAASTSGTPVSLSTSGTSVGGGTLLDLIDHAADDIYISGAVGTWVQIDFGDGRAVSPDYFTIRNNSNNYDPLRNWEWRGSNDLSTWTVLDARINDSTLSTASVWGGWSPNGPTGNYYRYVRLVRTGGTGGGGASYIRIGELELYGSLLVGVPLPSWATVWLSDGTHMWPGRPL